MNLYKYLSLIAILLVTGLSYAQETDSQERKPGHINENRFRQMYEEFSTPNRYRSASGAPGPQYYQQQADYVMDIVLDDKNATINGFETITYTNNSPDVLEYLWMQLDQNVRSKDSKSPLIEANGTLSADMASSFVGQYMGAPFDGGFKIQEVKWKGSDLPYTINQTMMRVEMPQDLRPGRSSLFL